MQNLTDSECFDTGMPVQESILMKNEKVSKYHKYKKPDPAFAAEPGFFL